MAGLQRSAVSFRRQGSSGLVWDDKLLSGELNQTKPKDQDEQEGPHRKMEAKPSRTTGSTNTIDRSRSGRAFHGGKVSPAIEPPSPKFSACGCCTAFGKPAARARPAKAGKRRS
ncbi:uncharacterized protein At1g15400-like [Malania oleifera]|uniref:uncharacterized protein At1g15400-like n=1 Tax=Malania oleifera TaxID=397392 RepID=UPI0025AE461C|nr:uncharacterized protein At1g15400-like [Malania oleifera]